MGTHVALGSAVRHAGLQVPAPIERRPPPSSNGMPSTPSTPSSPMTNGPYAGLSNGSYTSPTQEQRRAPGRGPRGEHLAEWMNQHRTLSPQQQQQALGHEPGFQTLPSDTQQRMRQRLSQLDAMNPEQRQRLLARNEAMERLTPDQRGEVRGALGQLGSLPMDQRRMVAHTFRALRDLPPQQRIMAFNTGRFGPPLNEGQRIILFNLLRVEPMLPPPASPVQTVRPAMPYPLQP
ncbi:MAG: DUF3106 domain-containing protein [Janthinobacterium lividum]